MERSAKSRNPHVLVVLQSALRQRVASKGLCVEINPSSNLLIANLGGLESHPLWRLNSPPHASSETPIPVCIGSDDPLTFATDLRGEYMLVHDTLVAHEKSYAVTEAWLDQVRATGMKYRFTLPRDRAWADLPIVSVPGKSDTSHLRMPPGA